MAARGRGLLNGWMVCLFGSVALFCAQTTAQAAAPPQGRAPTPASRLSPHTEHRAGHKHRRAEHASSVAPAAVIAPVPSSKVQFKDGRLTITATNSDLTDILHTISAQGGMTVAGPVPAQHVFGVYGPGTPREVLTQLLTGFGYNYMLVGTGPGGMPRQLVLSLPGAGASSLSASHAAPGSVAPSASSPDAQPAPAAQETADTSQASNGGTDAGAGGEPLGPGAIANVPPNESQDAQDPSNTGTRVQQNLQRLEQMQEAQSGQQGTPQ
jgi:hypothetical protein